MLCTNIRNTNYVNQIRFIPHKIADIKDYKSSHKEITGTRVRLDEIGVQDIESWIADFDCDSFYREIQQLYSLQSGKLVSEEAKDDLLSVFDDGEKKFR